MQWNDHDNGSKSPQPPWGFGDAVVLRELGRMGCMTLLPEKLGGGAMLQLVADCGAVEPGEASPGEADGVKDLAPETNGAVGFHPAVEDSEAEA